jgi:hypothetical protein
MAVRSMNKNQSLVADCINFIRLNTRIPIATTTARHRQCDGASWDGIQLIGGGLLVNPKYCHPGDLLHEVGHIVTVPMELRRWMNGWADDDGTNEGFTAKAWAYSEQHDLLHESNSIYGDLMHISDDSAATYWGCMVLKLMGEPLNLLFTNGFEYSLQAGDDIKDGVTLAMDSNSECQMSVAAYYAGLLESKRSIEPIAWDLGLLEEKRDLCF